MKNRYRIFIVALLLTCNVMNGSDAIGQSLTKTLETSLIDSMINDIDAGRVKDSLILYKDSVIAEKEKRITLLDTIILYNAKQINLLSERVELRTGELNNSLMDVHKLKDKVSKRNQALTILSAITIALTSLIIVK